MDESKGPYAALGGPLFVKKILGKAHYLIQASDSFYHEISPACFKATVARSTLIDTELLKRDWRHSMNSKARRTAECMTINEIDW